jgi:hypothetical protein
VTLERDVAKEIDRYLTKTLGLRVFRADQGGGRFARRTVGVGLPDRWGVLPNGRLWCVEIKRPGAVARKNEAKQNEVLAYLHANNALVIVASSLAAVHAALNPQTLIEHKDVLAMDF